MNLLKKMQETVAVADSLLSEDNVTKEVRTASYYSKSYYEYVKVWTNLGGKTFVLSRNLIDAFINTDISLNMLPNDFKYPFDSFVVEGEVPLFTTNSFEKAGINVRPVDTILYTSSEYLKKSLRYKTIDADGNELTDFEWDHALNAFFPASIGCSNIMLYMKNSATIQSAADIQKVGAGMVPVSSEDNQSLCNIFYNTLLYINDPSRNISETESRGSRKWKISGKQTVRNDCIYLSPPKSYKPLYASSGKTLDVRFIVRGHWRNQACGIGHKDHKRIWVLPYWKGPEMSEVVSKKYIVN